ncbi:hypothetical protein D3C81_1732760 [compost metagenome]
MADDEGDAVVDDLVGHRHGLLGIAGIVVVHAFEHLAVDPAGLVDLLDGHFRADELHLAVLGHRTGDRAGDGDLDGVRRQAVAGAAGHGNGGEQPGKLPCDFAHKCSTVVFVVCGADRGSAINLQQASDHAAKLPCSHAKSQCPEASRQFALHYSRLRRLVSLWLIAIMASPD